jgi:hypothetical protein
MLMRKGADGSWDLFSLGARCVPEERLERGDQVHTRVTGPVQTTITNKMHQESGY